MDEVMKQAEVAKLKRMALDKYEEDGGVMCECTSPAEYDEMIEKHGTAEAAWADHMRIEMARREGGGYYDVF